MTASQVKLDPSPVSDAAAAQLRRMLDTEPPPRRLAPVLITMVALGLAALLSSAMWHSLYRRAMDP